MQAAFTSTAQDRQYFQPCFDQFMQDNPLLAARTAQAFALAVTTYMTNLLPNFTANIAIVNISMSTKERAELFELRTTSVQPSPAHPRVSAPKKKAFAKDNIAFD